MATAPGANSPDPEDIRTTCCVVGAGPGGVMLSLLLARQGVPVTLLEMHQDFDRDFRGDTLHPGALEVVDQLGLSEQLLSLPHAKMEKLSFHTPGGVVQVADLSRLSTPFPFVTIVPQSQFLAMMVKEAQQYPHFQIRMGTKVRDLIDQNGTVTGVEVRTSNGDTQNIYADLTVGVDGRHSTVRKLSGLRPRQAAPGIDVLWFRLPRYEQQQGGAFLGPGGYMIVLERDSEWQVGFVTLKGAFADLKEAGIDRFRERIEQLAPALAESIQRLQHWNQIKFLLVEANCLRRWWRPGLLMLGDAAHVMSPVGGVGINVAIADAVEAANVLARPLAEGKLSQRDLRRVQQRRHFPVWLVQSLQTFDQKHLIEPALRTTGDYQLPLWLRATLKLPWIRDLPSRLLAFGGRRVRIADRG